MFVRWGAVQADAACGPRTEYEALSELSSAGVPEAVDLFRNAGTIWCATSWIDAGKVVADGPEAVVSVVRALVETVARAHRAGWVHGDVKPDNILQDAAGAVFLVDWESARRIGRPAPPGTLGYAPPDAWDGQYVASPRNDVWSLAVVAWELLSGRRAFAGDREAVLRAQRGFEFATTDAAPPLLAALFAAARRSAALDEILDDFLDDAAPRVDARRARACLARPEARRVAREASRRGASRRDVPGGADASGTADALAHELRLSDEFCVRAADFRGAVDASFDGADADVRTSRIERIRVLRRRRAGRLRAALARVPTAFVVGAADDASDDVALVDVAADATGAAGGGAAVLVVAHAADAVATDARNRLRCRAALEHLFLTTAVEDAAIDAVRAAAAGAAGDCVGSALALAGEDVLVRVGGRVTWRSPNGAVRKTAAGARPVSPTETGAAKLERLLSRAESLAATGRLAECAEACRDAGAALTSSVRPDEDAWRLADVWVECGRGDAALETVRGLPSSREPAARVRVGRILSSRGEFEELSAVVSGLDAAALGPDDRAEWRRLRALSGIPKREMQEAYRLLREALSDRASLQPSTVLWTLNTLGNVLRLNGRLPSARRVLRAARTIAEDVDSLRARAAIEGNLLLANEERLSASQAAVESWRIARFCFDAGLASDALVHGVGAAMRWTSAREPAKAVETIDAVRRLGAGVLPTSRTCSNTLDELRLAAVDVGEDWSEIGRAVGRPSELQPGTQGALHAWLLRGELGDEAPWSDAFPRGLRPGTEARAFRALSSLVKRPRASRRLAARALTAFLAAFDEFSPVLAHVARALLRAPDAVPDSLRRLLRASRDAAADGETARRFALSLHALVLAWRDDGGGENTVRWLTENLSTSERERPAGVRSWEWTLARETCVRHVAGHDASPVDIDLVLLDIERQLEAMGPRAPAYASGLPVDRLVRLAGGTAAGDALARYRRQDACAEIVALRAALQSVGAVDHSVRARAAGLERVLRSALELRPATETDRVLSQIVAGVLGVCRAERAVVLFDAGTGVARAKLATASGVAEIPVADAEISSTIIRTVRDAGRASVFDDACGDDGFGGRPSVRLYQPKSVIVAPLRSEGRFAGYIYVENRSVRKSFNESDLELIEGFAAQAELALENAQLVERLEKSCRDLEAARGEAVREESLRVLGRMASEVAHEFNNLLTGIMGETEMLRGDDALPAELRRSLEMIERSAQDGAAVIRRIQDSTRIRADQDFDLVDLRDTVAHVSEAVRLRAAHCGIRLDVSGAGAPLPVRGAAVELREVFTNIVHNAIDATPAGGRITIEGRVEGDAAVVAVRDSGCGMSAEVASRIFDPFFTTKGEKGNGLGLSLAFGIVRRHGGDIHVSSEVGVGTEMRVSLPCAPRDVSLPGAGGEGSAGRDSPAAAACARARSVLVVDDDPAVAHVLAKMLDRLGASSVIARDGVEALEIAASDARRFDLVLSDVNMPTLSGQALLDAMKQRHVLARFVLMTGQDGGDEDASHPVPGVKVLTKPFTLRDVERVVSGAS